MNTASRLDHQLAVSSLTITSTYYAEVWSEMDAWLGKHCQGATVLRRHSP